MEKPEIKIGDTYFMFDTNRRVYERDENGRAKGGPTFRGHFYEVKVNDETARSWLVGPYNVKVPKKDPWLVLYTPEMIDEKEWVQVHRYSIARAVDTVRDPVVLRKIAELVGYSPSAE